MTGYITVFQFDVSTDKGIPYLTVLTICISKEITLDDGRFFNLCVIEVTISYCAVCKFTINNIYTIKVITFLCLNILYLKF